MNCPDCEVYISRQARSCPKCGRLLLSLDFNTLQVIVQNHHKMSLIDSAIFTHKLIRTIEFINYEQMSIPEVRAKLRDIDMQIESRKMIQKEKFNEMFTQPLTLRTFPYLATIIGGIIGILLAIYWS